MGGFFIDKKRNMKTPESPISMSESFLVRDAEGLRPLMTSVSMVQVREDEFGTWQKVTLKRVCSPLTSFEMSTGRRLYPGVYSSRSGRYAFLRTSVLGLEEMSKFFNNGAGQLAKELLEELTRVDSYGLLLVQSRMKFDPEGWK